MASCSQYIRVGRPLTPAGRALNFGHYGRDVQGSRLWGFFWPSILIRGYDPNSFDSNECGPKLTQAASCPVFDHLSGAASLGSSTLLRSGSARKLAAIASVSLPKHSRKILPTRNSSYGGSRVVFSPKPYCCSIRSMLEKDPFKRSSKVISENNVESVPPIPVRTTSLIAFQLRWPSGNYEHSQR